MIHTTTGAQKCQNCPTNLFSAVVPTKPGDTAGPSIVANAIQIGPALGHCTRGKHCESQSKEQVRANSDVWMFRRHQPTAYQYLLESSFACRPQAESLLLTTLSLA